MTYVPTIVCCVLFVLFIVAVAREAYPEFCDPDELPPSAPPTTWPSRPCRSCGMWVREHRFNNDDGRPMLNQTGQCVPCWAEETHGFGGIGAVVSDSDLKAWRRQRRRWTEHLDELERRIEEGTVAAAGWEGLASAGLVAVVEHERPRWWWGLWDRLTRWRLVSARPCPFALELTDIAREALTARGWAA